MGEQISYSISTFVGFPGSLDKHVHQEPKTAPFQNKNRGNNPGLEKNDGVRVLVIHRINLFLVFFFQFFFPEEFYIDKSTFQVSTGSGSSKEDEVSCCFGSEQRTGGANGGRDGFFTDSEFGVLLRPVGLGHENPI